MPAPAPTPSGNVYLSAFNGTNPNGTWNLYVADDLSGSLGEITGGWSLAITTGAPPPPPPPCPPDCANVTQILIPDGPATPYPSTLHDTPGQNRRPSPTSTSWLPDLSHAEPDDVDLLLVGPTGTNAKVMSDAGGTTDAPTSRLTLDDQAATALPDSTALVTGSYQPADYTPTRDTFPAPAPAPSGAVNLSTFNGINPNGAWIIYVVDDTSGQPSRDTSATGRSKSRRFHLPLRRRPRVRCAIIFFNIIPHGTASPYPSTCAVSGAGDGTISDVNLV